jgi:hypothetical protein
MYASSKETVKKYLSPNDCIQVEMCTHLIYIEVVEETINIFVLDFSYILATIFLQI